MTIADRTWDSLPPEIHSRIMAATAQASVRRIRCAEPSGPDTADGAWIVDAITGDRFVHMALGLRADHSVSEETRTAVLSEIRDVSHGPDGFNLTLQGPTGPESIPVPEPIGRALDHSREGGFEGAVKGIGQGMAGRLKEVAGELLDLADLEEQGIQQQREAEIRRAQAESS